MRGSKASTAQRTQNNKKMKREKVLGKKSAQKVKVHRQVKHFETTIVALQRLRDCAQCFRMKL